MTVGDWLILAAVAVCIAAALICVVMRRKKGVGCSGDCSRCGGCSGGGFGGEKYGR